jgi:hypothetical protein
VKRQKLITLGGILVLLFSPGAQAASVSISANIGFDTPLSITKKNDISFGTVKAGVADTYTMSPSGELSVAGPGQWLSGTKSAGNITIMGSTTQTLSISVGNYTANGGVTPANATCSYAGGAAQACAIKGATSPGNTGSTLLLGIDAVVDGNQTAGSTATPSLTVTIVYG